MKKFILLSAIIIIVTSCINRDELLINDKWILNSSSIIGNSDQQSNFKFFKKSEEIKSIVFTKDYFATINEKATGKSELMIWQWDNNNTIRLYNHDTTIIYKVSKLTSDEFNIYQSNIPYQNIVFEFFKHSDYKNWWADAIIDEYDRNNP